MSWKNGRFKNLFVRKHGYLKKSGKEYIERKEREAREKMKKDLEFIQENRKVIQETDYLPSIVRGFRDASET